MIEGSVDVEGVPSIEFEVDGREWRAVIDTGFNGDLELPYTLRNFVRAKFIGRIRSLLAGGQTIDEDNFLVQFPFDGVVRLMVGARFGSDEIVVVEVTVLFEASLSASLAVTSTVLLMTWP